METKRNIKTDIEALKKELGLDQYQITDGRAELEKMIDKDKYYIVCCHSLPFKGCTVLKRNFQPSLVRIDLGYKLTNEQWDFFRALQKQGKYITDITEIPNNEHNN